MQIHGVTYQCNHWWKLLWVTAGVSGSLFFPRKSVFLLNALLQTCLFNITQFANMHWNHICDNWRNKTTFLNLENWLPHIPRSGLVHCLRYSHPLFCQGELTGCLRHSSLPLSRIKHTVVARLLLFCFLLRSISEFCASLWVLHCCVEAISPVYGRRRSINSGITICWIINFSSSLSAYSLKCTEGRGFPQPCRMILWLRNFTDLFFMWKYWKAARVFLYCLNHFLELRHISLPMDINSVAVSWKSPSPTPILFTFCFQTYGSF